MDVYSTKEQTHMQAWLSAEFMQLSTADNLVSNCLAVRWEAHIS